MLDRGTSGDAHSASVIEEREHNYDQGLEKLDFLSAQTPEQPRELPSRAEILEEVERLFRSSDEGQSDT